MKKNIIILFLGILPFLVLASINEQEAISIKPIENKLDYFQADESMSIDGSNFGTDVAKLKVFLNDKSYSVETSYGNQLKFKITPAMRSGQLYVTKQTEINEKTIVLESNRIDLNLKEPQIHRLESENGIKPNGEIIITGINLNGATFWCGQQEINRLITEDTKNTQDTYVKLVLPNIYLDCMLEVTNHKFSFLTKDKITVNPIFKPYSIGFQSNYIYISGSGFSYYSSSLSKLKLVFDDSSSLSSPELVSDEQIRFKVSQAIPNQGNAFLEVDKLLLPPVSYNFNNDIARITEVSDLSSTSDGKVEFAVSLSKSFDNLATSTIMMNGTKLTGTTDGNILKIKQASFTPTQVYKFWVEKEKFKGEIFVHTFEANFKPRVTQITAVYDLNKSGGRIKVEGNNFYPQESLKINDVNGEKLAIKNLENNSFEVVLPFGLKDGNLAINISNSYGSANPVNVVIPASKLKTFYPTPNITDIEYPEGPFFKKKINLIGSGLAKTSSINFGDKNYAIEWANDQGVSAVIPSAIEPTGKVSVLVNYKDKSNEVSYEVFSLPEERLIKIIYPLSSDVINLESGSTTIYQDLLDFSVANKKETASLFIKWKIECDKDCLSGIPFMAYKLLDEKNKEIVKAQFFIDSVAGVLSLNIPKSNVSMNDVIYKVQTKPFANVSENEVRKIKLLSVVARDQNDKVIDQVVYNTDVVKNVSMLANKTSVGFCKEIKKEAGKEDTWQDCPILRTRPADMSTTEYVETTKENSDFVVKDSVLDNKETVVPVVNSSKKFSFTDVKPTDWFYADVKNLYERGIITGYANNTFKPGDGINKAELLKMILVTRGEKWGTYVTASFQDTTNHWSKDMLEYALEKNYIEGNRTHFKPTEKVSRATTMSVLCAMFPVVKPQTQSTYFEDIKDNKHKDCIMTAYKLGIIKGANNNFKPNDFVTRAEFSKMLSQVLIFSGNKK